MNFDKSQIINLLKSQGAHDQADQAEAELPDTVDSDQHAGLLDKLGINVSDLASKLPGGLSDQIGKLGL